MSILNKPVHKNVDEKTKAEDCFADNLQMSREIDYQASHKLKMMMMQQWQKRVFSKIFS